MFFLLNCEEAFKAFEVSESEALSQPVQHEKETKFIINNVLISRLLYKFVIIINILAGSIFSKSDEPLSLQTRLFKWFGPSTHPTWTIKIIKQNMIIFVCKLFVSIPAVQVVHCAEQKKPATIQGNANVHRAPLALTPSHSDGTLKNVKHLSNEWTMCDHFACV